MKTWILISAWCVTLVSSGAVLRSIEPEPVDLYPQYQYSYSVQDSITGDVKGQTETRDGDLVRGQYSLVDPDGTLRTVTYTAGKEGFNAVVDRQVGYAAPAVKILKATSYAVPAPIAAAPIASLPPLGSHIRPVVHLEQHRPVQVVQHQRPIHVVQHQRPVQVIHQRPVSVVTPVQVQQPIHVVQRPVVVQQQRPVVVAPPVQPPQFFPIAQPQPQPPQVQPQPQQPESDFIDDAIVVPGHDEPAQSAPVPQPVPPPQPAPQPAPQPTPAPQPVPDQAPPQPPPQPQRPTSRPVTQPPQIFDDEAIVIEGRSPSVRSAGPSAEGSTYTYSSSRGNQYGFRITA